MSAPILDTEDSARARDLLVEADQESTSPFEWAVVRLLVLIVNALTQDTRS